MRKTNKGSTGNRLDPIDRITVKALLSSDNTAYQVSKKTGISHQTVMRIKRDPNIIAPAELDIIKRSMTGNMMLVADRITNSIDDDTIQNASLLQRVTSAGILIDKSRLMSNESTANVSMLGTYSIISDSFDKFSKQFDQQLTSDNTNYGVESQTVDEKLSDKVTGGGQEEKVLDEAITTHPTSSTHETKSE